MQTDEDKTIVEILAAIPSEEKQGEQETEAIPDFKDQEKEKTRGHERLDMPVAHRRVHAGAICRLCLLRPLAPSHAMRKCPFHRQFCPFWGV